MRERDLSFDTKALIKEDWDKYQTDTIYNKLANQEIAYKKEYDEELFERNRVNT